MILAWEFPPQRCLICGEPCEQVDARAIADGPIFVGWVHKDCHE